MALQGVISGKRMRPRRVLLYGTHGIGKAQPSDAKVLTSAGFLPMGEIRVGSKVIGSDGKPCNVLAVFPQGEKEVFRVTFRDGSSTECCDDHLWFTQTDHEAATGLTGAVRALKDIRKTLVCGTRFNHGVPRVNAVEFEPQVEPLPLNPWLLGIYLGDGSCAENCSVIVTNEEKDIQERISRSIASTDECSPVGGTTRITRKYKSAKTTVTKAAIESIGLLGLDSYGKFIPTVYLHASVECRLEILRGLLDSDGFVHAPGAVEFSTTSKRLANDVCFLVRSLGASAVLSEKIPTYVHNGEKKTGHIAYRIHASFPDSITPVSSAKHLAKWQASTWKIRHTIRSVEAVGMKQCQCLVIDSLDALYVTDDFLLTHNSTWAASSPKPIVLATEDGLDDVGADRTPLLTSTTDVGRWLIELGTPGADHGYQTVVIDTLDWLEKLIWQATCRDEGKDSIEDFGYGKGYTYAVRRWEKLLGMLDGCREAGMNVVLLSHAKVERFSPPDTDPYDRWQPDIHKAAAALVQEWADEVLFARYRVNTIQRSAETVSRPGDKREAKRTVAIGTGDRVVYTSEAPTHAAKRRIQMPDQLPLDWSEYARHWPTGQQQQAGASVASGDISGIVTDGHSKRKEAAT